MGNKIGSILPHIRHDQQCPIMEAHEEYEEEIPNGIGIKIEEKDKWSRK